MPRELKEKDKRKIERDLLLESTILLVSDKQLNNKSVSNRTATALVGMCVGHPGLMRFGLEGFYKTINEWYLGDGTSSESPFYGFKPSALEADLEPVLTLPYDLTKPTGSSSFSLYYRKPGLENKFIPTLTFPYWCPPQLRIGHLRTGNDGRESLLLLSASHWGVHHENDSLNLYYWKKGREILSDLGYLWDHPLKPQNIRTVAHNTVVIDEKSQIGKGRGGDVLCFKTFENVKVMEMSSSAYPEATLYRRTSAIIDHGKGQNYVVDFFRVEGGKQQDYIFHGVEDNFGVEGLELQSLAGELYDFRNIRKANGAGIWTAKWNSGDAMTCVAWSVGQPGEQAMIADGWGQRDWKNSDIGATIPYIVRRCKGEGVKTFISVFEGYEGASPFVQNVRVIDPEGTLLIETALGQDYVMSMPDTGVLKINSGTGQEEIKAHFAAGSVQHKKLAWSVNVQP
jgi:hypothetical protein